MKNKVAIKKNLAKETLKTIRKFPILNRKKTDPNKFIYTGEKKIDKIDIQLFKYDKENCSEKKGISIETIEKFGINNYCYWLNIYGLDDSEGVATICQKQGIHDLVIQDILDVNQRPKYQDFEEFSFLTLKSILPNSSELLTEQISFVFADKFLISFQERKADYFEHLRYRLREGKGIIRERGADFLLYSMLESILDNYFKTLNQLETEIEELNLTDTKKEPSPDILGLIESNKKIVRYIKKSIIPIKEFAILVERKECKYIDKRHLKYYLEIKDLCLTLIDNCDMLESSLESSINLFFSIQGHRMNQVMKTLTIVATIFIPITFIVGIYGMNFRNMPEIQWEYGYLSVWILIVLATTGMIIYFKNKKWF